MASKNSLERINGRLFVHGGIHPKISEFDYTLEEINTIVRKNYRKPYYTKVDSNDEDKEYFEAVSAKNVDPSHGYALFTVSEDALSKDFIGVNGSFEDSFSLTRR